MVGFTSSGAPYPMTKKQYLASMRNKSKKKKQKTGGKPAAKQQNQQLAAKVSALQKRISQMRVQRPDRGHFDRRIVDYLHAVINPWTAPLTHGLTSDRMIPSTAVARRMNAFTLNLASGNSSMLLDMFLPLNGALDPYLAFSQSVNNGQDWSPGTLIGRDETEVSIPVGSYARVIGAQVRIRYQGAVVDCGGSFYHFPHDRAASGFEGITEGNKWGDTADELLRAVSVVPLSRIGAAFNFAPEDGFAPVSVHPVSEFSSGVPISGTTTSMSGFRILFTGPQKAVNFTVEVCEMIEYFHTSHRHNASPIAPHPVGTAVQQAVSSHMEQPGSGNSSPHTGVGRFVEAVSEVAGKAAGAVESVGKLVANAISLKNMVGAARSAGRYAEGAIQIVEL